MLYLIDLIKKILQEIEFSLVRCMMFFLRKIIDTPFFNFSLFLEKIHKTSSIKSLRLFKLKIFGIICIMKVNYFMGLFKFWCFFISNVLSIYFFTEGFNLLTGSSFFKEFLFLFYSYFYFFWIAYTTTENFDLKEINEFREDSYRLIEEKIQQINKDESLKKLELK